MNNSICSTCGFKIKSNIIFALEQDLLSYTVIENLTNRKIKSSTDKKTKTEKNVHKTAGAVQDAEYYEEHTALTFMMPIDRVFNLKDKGTVISGKVKYGAVKRNSAVDVVMRNGCRITAIVELIEMDEKSLEFAQKGNSVIIRLLGIKRDDLVDARYIVNKKADYLCWFFSANLHVMTKAEGGKGVLIFDFYKPIIKINNREIRGFITFNRMYDQNRYKIVDPRDGMLMPGSTYKVFIALDKPAFILPDTKFLVTEGDSVLVGNGTIIEVDS